MRAICKVFMNSVVLSKKGIWSTSKTNYTAGGFVTASECKIKECSINSTEYARMVMATMNGEKVFYVNIVS